MKAEFALFILRKLNVPNAIKGGLLLSYVVFYSLDINGRVARFLAAKEST